MRYLLALALTACTPLHARQVASLGAAAGGAAAAIAYPAVRDEGLAECVATKIGADLLPDVASAIVAPDGQSVRHSVDVTECLSIHDARPVDLLADPERRDQIGAALTGLLVLAPASVQDPCGRRWIDAVASALASLSDDLLTALGESAGAVEAIWTTPSRCGRE